MSTMYPKYSLHIIVYFGIRSCIEPLEVSKVVVGALLPFLTLYNHLPHSAVVVIGLREWQGSMDLVDSLLGIDLFDEELHRTT